MVFRQVEFLDQDRLRLAALTSESPERIVPRAEVKQMWKLIRHMRSHIHEAVAALV
jgi:hypothetical protein